MVEYPGPPTPPPPPSPYGPYSAPSPPPVSARPPWTAGWVSRAELRSAAVIIVVLAALGALLGLVWDAWSPPGPLGFVVTPGAVETGENEAFVAADGRFAIIVLVVGLIAGLVVFFWKRTRGPAAIVALAIGGVAGAVLTDLVGHVARGGVGDGKANTYIAHLPLSVQMQGLLVVEGAMAVLVYGLCVAFAPDDDLGRPEPGLASVGVSGQLQYGGGYTDAAGQLQQRHLPPQQFDRPL